MSADGGLLVFERGELIGPALASVMANHGVEVDVCRDFEDLQERGLERAVQASCVFVDGDPASSGAAALVRSLREGGCTAPIVVLVESHRAPVAEDVLGAGATQVISIPLAYAYVMNRLGDFETGDEDAGPHRLVLGQGVSVTVRFLHPDDAEIEQAFVRGLSDEARRMRFFSPVRELSRQLLEQFTHSEFPRSYAVIATVEAREEGGAEDAETLIGVARYSPTGEADTAEFAVVVADAWQGFGLATQLMQIIILVAAMAGYRQLDGVILRENRAMLGLSSKLGFETVRDARDDFSVVRVRKALAG